MAATAEDLALFGAEPAKAKASAGVASQDDLAMFEAPAPVSAQSEYAAPQPAAKPGLFDRAKNTLFGIGRTIKGGAQAAGEIVSDLGNVPDNIAAAAREPGRLLHGDFAEPAARRRQLERGLDDMLTLGHGQRLAARIGNALGDAPETAIGPETFGPGIVANTQAADQEAAPEFRDLGHVAGMLSGKYGGAQTLAAKAGGRLAGGLTRGMGATTTLGKLALGGARGGLGYASTAPVLSALEAGNEGRRLEAAGEAATDPVGLGLGAALGAAAETGPSRIRERAAKAVVSGDTNANAKTSRKFRERAGDEFERFDSVLDENPDLEKRLATVGRTSPARALEEVTGAMDKVSSQTPHFYETIDARTEAKAISERDARARTTAQQALDAQARAETLDAEAKKLAPKVEKKEAKAASYVNKELREAAEARALVARHALDEITAQAKDATKEAKALDREGKKIEREPAKGGIDLSAIDASIQRSAEALAREGKAAEALAVSRSRGHMAALYGEDGEIAPGTILPAKAVRTLATELGKTAFAGDVLADPGVRARAEQRVHGAITGALETAAEGAGLDVTELRKLNRDMSVLIPMKRSLQERTTRAETNRESLKEMLKPKGLLRRGAESAGRHLDYQLSRTAPGVAGAGLARTLEAKDRERGGPEIPTLASKFLVAGSFPGLVEPGNIDLTNRPDVANADGSHSSVRSMSFEENGQEVLVPTVSEDGRIMTDDEAIEQYRRTGRNLGKFATPDAATDYAEKLHEQQAGAMHL